MQERLHEKAKRRGLEENTYLQTVVMRDLSQEEAEQPKHNIMELEGLCAGAWAGVDVQEYINEMRDEWGASRCAIVALYFLDLQGTLGGDGLGDIRDFGFYPCAVPALRLLSQAGMLNIILTNQSHIGKGWFTYQQYEERAEELQAELSRAGVKIDAIYCCPHSAFDACVCQKPKLGMVSEAQQEFGIDLSRSFVVGDMGSSDMLLAHAAGCKGVLVRTGVGESSLDEFRHTWASVEPSFVAANALQAAEWITEQAGKDSDSDD